MKSSVWTRFLEACAQGDSAELRVLLARDRGLVRRSAEHAPGWTGLHEAARHGQLDVVRILLEHGADVNAREAGDNTCPLHWAAAQRHLDVVRTLLDAGADVQGKGDVHELEAIGWATYFRGAGAPMGDQPEVAALLVERGARHHVFSAMALGDVALLRRVVRQDRAAVRRKMSRFEDGLTALHFALRLGRLDMLRVLIRAGAPLEAKDGHGLTAMEAALFAGNEKAMAVLRAAGAKQPKAGRGGSLAKLAESVSELSPMIYVADVAATLDWYVGLGFREVARYGDDGLVNFGVLALGKAEILVNMNGQRGAQTASLWFATDRVDAMYKALRRPGIEVVEHINDTFYGARQFGIRDLNGYLLYFIQLRG